MNRLRQWTLVWKMWPRACSSSVKHAVHSCLLRFEVGGASSWAGVSGATSASCRKSIIILMLARLSRQALFDNIFHEQMCHADATCVHATPAEAEVSGHDQKSSMPN